MFSWINDTNLGYITVTNREKKRKRLIVSKFDKPELQFSDVLMISLVIFVRKKYKVS